MDITNIKRVDLSSIQVTLLVNIVYNIQLQTELPREDV